MRHVGSLAICFAVMLTWVSSPGALEVKDRAKAPLGWWDAAGPMAIPPQYFDQGPVRVRPDAGRCQQGASDLCPQGRRQGRLGDGARTYTPSEMDQILSAYGVKLTDPSKCPPTYARVVDGKPVFESAPIAWGPREIDRILSAYQ